jgi:hypothetical protein
MMKGKKITLLSLVILGLLFSSVLGFDFNLANGFEFHRFWFKPSLQLVDYAGSSPEQILTSQLAGYAFYLLFGMLIFNEIDWSNRRNTVSFLVFVLLIALVIFSDFYSFYQDLTHQFAGRHLRLGQLTGLIGLALYARIQRQQPVQPETL